MSKFSRFNHMHEGVPFMNGRTLAKVTTLVGSVIHITDFAFLNRTDPETGELKSYAVFIISENGNNFYFGSQGINEVLASLSADEKTELASVPVTVKQGTAVKSGNSFTYLEFPED